MRKVSGGTRSSEGTTTRLTLASVFHTWAACNFKPLRGMPRRSPAAERRCFALNSFTRRENSYAV